MTLNLIVQYYKCDDEARQQEIDVCLSKNLSNELISSIHLLSEQLYDLSRFQYHEKIKQTVIGERLTFETAFHYANEHHENQIWILCNADIYFDSSLSNLDDAKLDVAVFALTRHDIQKDGTLKMVDPAFSHGCQDAWIFKTPISLDKLFAKFYLGIPGCDNRIAYELITAGYKIINPSNKIIVSHLDLTRDTNIFERNKEYARLMNEDNYNRGLSVPPPYQYHLYPADQVDPDSIEMYKSYLVQFAINNQRIAELENYKYLYNGLLQTWSWKITAPLRFICNLFNN